MSVVAVRKGTGGEVGSPEKTIGWLNATLNEPIQLRPHNSVTRISKKKSHSDAPTDARSAIAVATSTCPCTPQGAGELASSQLKRNFSLLTCSPIPRVWDGLRRLRIRLRFPASDARTARDAPRGSAPPPIAPTPTT